MCMDVEELGCNMEGRSKGMFRQRRMASSSTRFTCNFQAVFDLENRLSPDTIVYGRSVWLVYFCILFNSQSSKSLFMLIRFYSYSYEYHNVIFPIKYIFIYMKYDKIYEYNKIYDIFSYQTYGRF